MFQNSKITCVSILLLLLPLVALPAQNDSEISKHIGKCCVSGLKQARTQKNCDNYEYEVQMTIPELWRGLCYSTYSVCCSRKIDEQYCLAGRQAALTGSRCDEPYNTTVFADCCRACQVGLAVKFSENSCDDVYFTKIESYRICCSEGGSSNRNTTSPQAIDKNIKETDIYLSMRKKVAHHAANLTNEADSEEEDDGAIVLPEDDDDLCGKVKDPICHQICENTKEGYRCNCHSGYVLQEDNITCVLKKSSNVTNKDLIYGDSDNIAAGNKDHTGSNGFNSPSSIICSPGYEPTNILSEAVEKCVDIDECARPHLIKCTHSQYCHNTIGSYRCLSVKEFDHNCELGYIYGEKQDKCEDINECTDTPCEVGYQCANTIGSYECKKKSTDSLSASTHMTLNISKCLEGFHYKHGNCLDIDECAMDENACDSNQLCTNDIGGYHCNCKIGFNLDTTTNACVDINECSINNHNCLPTQRCDNTVGSYVCTRLQGCGTGYTLNAETGICVDDDECALKTHNCPDDYECYNTKGSFRCYRRQTSLPITNIRTISAKPLMPISQWSPFSGSAATYFPTGNQSNGYVSKQIQNRQQLQLDYALRYAGNMANDLERKQQPNWDRRGNLCELGFKRSYQGACVDVNECLQQQVCGSHQRCINTNGSYRCQNLLQCLAGYKSTPDGTQCVDIDECEIGEHNCVDNQICRNRQGGYICACPPGHNLQQSTESDNQRCVDINECQHEHSVCPLNAQCLNTVGSYYCECKSGFQKSRDNERICLDVNECQEVLGLCQQKCVNFWGGYRCSCNHGYELGVDNRTCNDVDECEIYKSNKLCMGSCINVPGSYECSCPRGYTLAMDRISCRDKDECATGEFCTGRNDVCTNIRGSFKCTTIYCPFGYINDPDQKNRCRQASNLCEEDDCTNKPFAYTYNFITLVSKLPIPPDGRTIFSLRGASWYDNIDFDLKIIKIQAANNIEKISDHYFDTIKGDHEVHLKLRRSLEGPQDIELELTMTVFTNGLPRGKSVAKIFVLVSQYTF